MLHAVIIRYEMLKSQHALIKVIKSFYSVPRCRFNVPEILNEPYKQTLRGFVDHVGLRLHLHAEYIFLLILLSLPMPELNFHFKGNEGAWKFSH